MSAWDDALDREKMKEIVTIINSYDNELDLLDNMKDFGERVWEVMLSYDIYTFGQEQS